MKIIETVRAIIGSMTPKTRIALVLFAVLLAGLFLLRTTGMPHIEVHDAYAISRPDYGTITIFATLHNHGGAGDILLSARILEYPDARVELHTLQDGKMSKVESVSIPAHGEIQLNPKGYHIMGLEIQNLKASGEITLVLSFERSGEVKVVAPVKTKVEGMQHSGPER